MGRKRTHLKLNAPARTDLRRRLRVTKDPRERERLQVALWAAEGDYTLEDLARMAGRARASIQTWLNKFAAGGLEGLVRRDTPPGSSSPLGSAQIQAELRAGLAAGRWRSASEIAVWLEAEHGIRRARKSIYYWLRKTPPRRGPRGASG
jgi:transposase